MNKLLMIVNEDRFFLSHRLPIALAARDNGLDVIIVAKDTGCKDKILEYDFKFINLPVNPTGMNILQEFKTFYFLKKLYSLLQPDIVHHVGLKNILWGGLAAKLTNIYGVVNAVSGLGGLFNGGRLNFITKCILRIMKYSNNRPGVTVIFQNNDDKKIFLKSNVVNINQIYFTKGSGININEYNYHKEPDDNKIRIIFTGRMVKEKGICDLIEAAELLKSEFQDKIQFILCGRLTPNKSGVTKEYMTQHCDGKYICWLGERSDIKNLLQNSHIMAFPSYYREGLPKSLIEASAIGRPIITCNSTGCREVVEDGKNGFLIEPRNPIQLANKLRILVLNKELRVSMGKEARKKAERDFSIEKVVETHLKIYKELLTR